MALMQLTVIPLGTSEPGVGAYVAEIEQYLRTNNIDHRLNDMGTVIYGSADDLFQLARELHSIPFNKGALRVVTQFSIDERRDKDPHIDEKMRSVLDRLEKKPL